MENPKDFLPVSDSTTGGGHRDGEGGPVQEKTKKGGVFSGRVSGMSTKAKVLVLVAVFGLAGLIATLSTFAATTTQSFFSDTDKPKWVESSDGKAVELGLKFKTTTEGFVSGVKFYKGSPANGGVHAGSLWKDGQRLTTVIFRNETASGWQSASFPSPVKISANTEYVISYWAPQGHYSQDVKFFDKSLVKGSLKAEGKDVNVLNGVHMYGGRSMPSNTYEQSNYYVDVIFSPNAQAADSRPSAVTGMSVNGVTDTTATVAWGAPTDKGSSDVTGYKVSWSEAGTGRAWQSTPPHYGLNSSPLTLTGLIAGKKYDIQIVAVNKSGEGVVTSKTVTTTGGLTSGGSPVPTVPQSGIVKVMPMGDSLTAVDASSPGYKGLLYDSLTSQGYKIDYVGSQTSTGPAGIKDPNHEGHPGWQNSNFQPLVTGYINSYSPDVLLYFVGTNDLWSNIPPATAVDRLKDVLSKAYAAKPSLKVVVVQTPKMGVSQDAGRATYNAGVANVAAQFKASGKNITVADMSNVLTSSELQRDGIHWTYAGHQKIAAALAPIMKGVVGVTTAPVVTSPTPTPSNPSTGGSTSSAPMPYPNRTVALYHMMWSNSGSPALSTTPANVNVIRMSFAQGEIPTLTGWASDGEARFIESAKALRARGVRMTVSVGGAQGHLNVSNRQGFVNGIMAINNKIPLDGLDWDVEGSTAFGSADVQWISGELRRLRGPNFAITMAPNGSNIGQYLPIAVALHRAGNLQGFGQQFYDAPVSKEAAMGRIDQAVAAGIPADKYEVGMMIGNTSNYWTVEQSITNMNYIKNKYPNIKGGYLWEAGRAGTADWSNRVGSIIYR